MSRIYTPALRLTASSSGNSLKGSYGSADEVVRTSLKLLEEQVSELQELRHLIAEGDADVAAGWVYRYANAEEFMADIIAEEKNSIPAKKLIISLRARGDIASIYVRLKTVSGTATAKRYVVNHVVIWSTLRGSVYCPLSRTW